MLDLKTEMKFRRFVCQDLAEKYQMPIEVNEDIIVTGTTGNDTIMQCLKIRFFPVHSKVEWGEDKIASDIHRYCYENDLMLEKYPVIERDVWTGKIRYGLIYII